jgi:hypothetical protein
MRCGKLKSRQNDLHGFYDTPHNSMTSKIAALSLEYEKQINIEQALGIPGAEARQTERFWRDGASKGKS